MKKAFTLIAMAMLCVVGANAQTENFAVAGKDLPTNNQETTVQATTNVLLTYGADTGWKTTKDEIKNTSYTKGLSGSSNPKGKTSYTEENKDIPTTGVYYIFKPAKSGEIKVAMVLNNFKSFYVIDGTDGTYLKNIFTLSDNNGKTYTLSTNKDSKDKDVPYSLAAKLTGYCTFNVGAGKEYYVFCTGSKLTFLGFEFTPATSPTATINTYGYSTFASDKALDFTGIEGLTAYTAKVNGDVLALTPVTKVAAGTGLVLKGEGGKTYEIPGTTVEGKTESDLKAAVAETTPETEGVVNYVLSNIDDVTGFYRFTGTTIPAGKAYLQLPAAQAAKGFKMVFGDATGISNVNARKSANADNAYYTLSGIRTEAPVKGLYIRNGKKIIVK